MADRRAAVPLLLLAIAALLLLPACLGAPSAAPAPSAPPPPPVAVPAASVAWTPAPRAGFAVTVLAYPHFTVGYDEQARSPAWVAYALAGPIVERGHGDRPSVFQTEFRTVARVAQGDYRGSGFDRGHLCPSYALWSRFGAAAMASTFVMSNVIPQYHGLNAGEWEDLEAAIAGRSGQGGGWAERHGPLWVVNGPVYERRPAAASLRNGTWIPTACFSVVLRRQGDGWDALAFLMPNQPQVAGPYRRYLTSVAAINRATHLDLLAGLPAEDKARLDTLRADAPW